MAEDLNQQEAEEYINELDNNGGEGVYDDESETPEAEGEEQEEEKKEKQHSSIYKVISNLSFMFLLGLLGVALTAVVFTIDFLDIYTFRYKIPEKYRKKWPLDVYYDFVQQHQLPEEQRYHELMMNMQKEMENVITQGNKDLETRAAQLEKSYRALIKTQKEKYNSLYDALTAKEEEYEEKLEKLNAEKEAVEQQKTKNKELADRLASETANVTASLIKFMENQNRLDQICCIAAQMEPKALARVFDDMTDVQLIYDIMGGLQPSHSARVLGAMDTEKAGRVIGIGQQPPKLPAVNQDRSYIPPGLKKLVDDTKNNADEMSQRDE